MMPKVVMLVALVALVSGASALNWQKCGNADAEVTKVEIAECDNSQDVCELQDEDYYSINLHFVLTKTFEEHQYMRVDYAENDSQGSGGIGIWGLHLPEKVGQEQHLTFLARPPHARTDKMRVTVKSQNGGLIPEVCVDIPIKVAGHELI